MDLEREYMELRQENKKLKELLAYQTSVCRWISEKVELKGISGEIVKDFLGHVANETEMKLDELE